MVAYVQASARVPEEGRPVLLEIAAQMRADPAFIDKAAAWIAAERAGGELVGWRAAIERRLDRLDVLEARIEALEAAKAEGVTQLPKTAASPPPDAPAPASAISHDDPQFDIEDVLPPVEPVTVQSDREPAGGEEPVATDVTAWTTGAGKGTKLTPAGQREVLRLHGEAVSNAEIGRRVGVSGTSVANFLKRYDGAREEPLSG